MIRTTNGGANWCSGGGSNWCSFSFIGDVNSQYISLDPHVNFINNNIGFISFEKGMLKTTDGGASWTQILSTITSGGNIKKVIIDNTNNHMYVAGFKGSLGNFPVLYKSTDQGSNFQVLADGSDEINGVSGITDATLLSSNKLLFTTSKGVSKYESGSFAFVSEPEPHEYYNYEHIAGYGNKVIIYLFNRSDPEAQNKIFASTDGGINWTEDYDFIKKIRYAGNVSSVLNFVALENINTSASHKTFFHVKEMSVSSQLLFDNVPQSSTKPFYINDYTGNVSTEIPGNYALLGGTMSYSLGANGLLLSNPERKFYKWQNGHTMPVSSLDYIVDENYHIKANYKTKNISTDNTAISKAASTKSVKEAHGYIDRVHTSMGGVFFSRSTDNGSIFSQEEIVNDNWGNSSSYVTLNNINPQIAEVKTSLSGGVDAGKNSAIVWERRDGNTINIMYAQREVLSSVGSWHMDGIGISGSNSFTVDVSGYPDFQCQPKLSVIRSASNSDIYYAVISYLKPEGAGTKLMARVHIPGNTAFNYEVASGDITDFAAHSVSAAGTAAHEIHYSYK